MNDNARKSNYISPKILLANVFDEILTSSGEETFETYDNEQNINGTDLFFN